MATVTADQIINNCLVWYGSGTGGVATRLDAINDLVTFFRGKFITALLNDPNRWTDVDAAHTLERLFVLRCSEAIGRLAAMEATKRGATSIAVQDVQAARVAVINANSPSPGDWCN
jgi:hypothetical protein